MFDKFGDRMKMYENYESDQRFLPLLPVCVRLDGKNFSKFTRGLQRPYDEVLSNIMIDTTTYLVKETNACIGYTQSDEISLIYYSDDMKSQIFHDGRKQKMLSILSALCSMKFNQLLQQTKEERFENKKKLLPVFDCRAWVMPNLIEATNVIRWREFDAVKNSIQCAAQEHYSNKELLNKHTGEQQEMLFQKGINWNEYPTFYKRGTYIQRIKVNRKFTTEEFEKLPLKHEARKNPDLIIERTEFIKLDMPPVTQVTNLVDVIFNYEKPTITNNNVL